MPRGPVREPGRCLLNGQIWLEDVRRLYREHKATCERAVAQVSDEGLFATPLRGENSIAVVLKHVGGNMRSRWRGFLTLDGEKSDRNRDGEFETSGQTRAEVMAVWEEGWRTAFDELEQLGTEDLERTVTIRGEPCGVIPAVHRNLLHVAWHAGQIVELARDQAGDAWQTLSIARGESEAANARMRAKFGDWTER
jgi:hypothetical protein